MVGGFAVLVAVLSVGQAAAQEWQVDLQCKTALEELRPRVTLVRSGTGTVGSEAGVLTISVPDKGTWAFVGIGSNPAVPGGEPATMGDASAWDGRKPTTIEARLRVVSIAPWASAATQLCVGDGRHNWLLTLGPGGAPGLDLDATAFHTYRITLHHGAPNLYVDGALAPSGVLQRFTYPRNAVLIGPISSSVGGVSEWEYVKWTNREATPWQASPEELRQVEKETVVVGDVEGDVEEPNIGQPYGEIATLPDGRLITWYPQGKGTVGTPEAEEAPDKPDAVEKACARFSADHGRTWSGPEDLFEFPRGPGSHLDGMALVTRSGALHLWGLHFFRCPVKFPFDYSQFHSDLWHARSPDGGRTWEPVQQVPFGYAYTGASNSAIQLDSGRILVPISRYSDRPTGRFVTCVPYSDDDGVTWHEPLDEIVVDTGGQGLESGACEPVATELRDGRVWMLIRAQDGWEWESFSGDGGLHWSPPVHSRFLSTNAPVATLRLSDGNILVVWNNCTADAAAGIRADRFVLAAAVSPDEGKTWHGYREIMRLAESGVVAYPYVTQARDGKVVVVALQGPRMVRVDPAFLMRTSFREDFRDGLGRWSQVGTEGAEAVADPDGGDGRVLRLRKTQAETPAAACLNFPFAAAGSLTMQVRVEPGFRGAHIALTDCYSLPAVAKEGDFALQVTADGKLVAPAADKSPAPTGAVLTGGQWHRLRLAWDCAAREAELSLDDRKVADLTQMGERPGLCYLRLRLLADKTDQGGLLVREVATEGS